jgi:hypothetical protein
LFYSYLGTLGLILLIKLGCSFTPSFLNVIAHLAAFFAVASFIWSFDLPLSLYAIQRDKFDSIVSSRQKGGKGE